VETARPMMNAAFHSFMRFLSGAQKSVISELCVFEETGQPQQGDSGGAVFAYRLGIASQPVANGR
jgi:hypothetical protein